VLTRVHSTYLGCYTVLVLTRNHKNILRTVSLVRRSNVQRQHVNSIETHVFIHLANPHPTNSRTLRGLRKTWTAEVCELLGGRFATGDFNCCVNHKKVASVSQSVFCTIVEWRKILFEHPENNVYTHIGNKRFHLASFHQSHIFP